jgi:hypothetical protein
LAGDSQYRQIASVNDVQAKAVGCSDESSEFGIQLGRSTRDVDGPDLRGLGQDGQDAICSEAGHALGAIRTGIDVAVRAGLIAVFSHVDLHR